MTRASSASSTILSSASSSRSPSSVSVSYVKSRPMIAAICNSSFVSSVSRLRRRPSASRTPSGIAMSEIDVFVSVPSCAMRLTTSLRKKALPSVSSKMRSSTSLRGSTFARALMYAATSSRESPRRTMRSKPLSRLSEASVSESALWRVMSVSR